MFASNVLIVWVITRSSFFTRDVVNRALLLPGQFVAACKGSLRRLGMEQLGIGQLHWSTANYQPLQERALWDGLVALHDEVTHL